MATKDTGKVNIHGKDYETVASRVNRFREDKATANHSLITEIVDRSDDAVVMKASIIDPDGRVIATGYAEESRTSSQINRTSALENCETSALGRALANFGIGGTEFASADEVANAIHQQAQPAKSYGTPDKTVAALATPTPAAPVRGAMIPAQSARIYKLGGQLGLPTDALEARVQSLKTSVEAQAAITALEEQLRETGGDSE